MIDYGHFTFQLLNNLKNFSANILQQNFWASVGFKISMKRKRWPKLPRLFLTHAALTLIDLTNTSWWRLTFLWAEAGTLSGSRAVLRASATAWCWTRCDRHQCPAISFKIIWKIIRHMKYFWNKYELSYPFVVLIQLRDVEDLVRVADFSAHPFQLPIPRFKLTQFETLHAIRQLYPTIF